LNTFTISLNPQTSKIECTPEGTLINTFCSGTNKYGTYADGSCGTYNQVIETNSTDCGYTPPITTYTVNAGLQAPEPVSTVVDWDVTNTNPAYFQSGSPTLSTSSTPELVNNAPEGSTLTMDYPSSFVYNSKAFTLTSITVNGSSADVGLGVTINDDLVVYGNYITFGPA